MLDLSVSLSLGTAKRAHVLISCKFALKVDMMGTCRDRLDLRKGNFEKILTCRTKAWGAISLKWKENLLKIIRLDTISYSTELHACATRCQNTL